MEEIESIEEEERSMTIEDGLIAGLSRFIMTLIERAIKDVKMWVNGHFLTIDNSEEIAGNVEEVDSRVDDLVGRMDDWDNGGHVSPEQMDEAISAAFEHVNIGDIVSRVDRLESILESIYSVLQDNL